MDESIAINRRAWDERAAIHAQGNAYYPVDEFRAGRAGLYPNTPDDLGSVRGKRLLHLQCHIGMDSLSWVRQGAVVTGVDFSPASIVEARKLADESGLDATFLEADVCHLPDELHGEFDIVLSYYGTIMWLADLKGWARGIARCLKPGGFFYLADLHPLSLVMEVPDGQSVPQPRYAYFGDGQPIRCEASGAYAVPLASIEHTVTYQWQHTVQDILAAMTEAGLRLEFLHEFPYVFYERFSHPDRKLMRKDSSGWWHLLEGSGRVPLMLSIKAARPA